jgi:hypothetical protein
LCRVNVLVRRVVIEVVLSIVSEGIVKHLSAHLVSDDAALELTARHVESVHLSHSILRVFVSAILNHCIALVLASERVLRELDRVDVAERAEPLYLVY